MRILCSLVLIFVSHSAFAERSLCANPTEFVSYQTAKQSQKAGNHEEALGLFCMLAFSGDYRAQFQMARYYSGEINSSIEPNAVYALVWAKLSNSQIVSRSRTQYTDQLGATLAAEQRLEANKLFARAARAIPASRRIDQQITKLDMDKVMRQYQRETGKQQYTGTRIKREDKPLNLSVFYLD